MGLRRAESRPGEERAARELALLLAAMPPEHIARQVARLTTQYRLDTSTVTSAVADTASPATTVGPDAGGRAGGPARGDRPVVAGPVAASMLVVPLVARLNLLLEVRVHSAGDHESVYSPAPISRGRRM